MTTLYYAYYPKPLSEPLFISYLSTLKKPEQENILKYKKWEDRHSRLFARLLLHKAVQDITFSDKIPDIVTNKHGKPCFEDHNCYFNFSHSGNLVVVAVNRHFEVGVDVEVIRNINIQSFKSIFRDNEWKDINSGPSSAVRKFFQYWSKKESIIKADGRGLAIPLKEIVLEKNTGLIDGKKWFLAEATVDEHYSCWISSEKSVAEVRYKPFNFY